MSIGVPGFTVTTSRVALVVVQAAAGVGVARDVEPDVGDPNGLPLEPAALGAPDRADAPDAVRGFDAVTLCVEAPERSGKRASSPR